MRDLSRHYLESPFAIACTYLALIPLFALMYAQIWADLYQFTAPHDAATVSLCRNAVLAARARISCRKWRYIPVLTRRRLPPVTGHRQCPTEAALKLGG